MSKEIDDDKYLDVPVDYGLIVKYDGRKNEVLYENGIKYEVGEMMCELGRIVPAKIKDIIISYSGFHKETSEENIEASFVELEEKLIRNFGVATGKILCSELLGYTASYIKNRDDPEYYSQEEVFVPNNEVNKFIFENTGFDQCGDSCVGQLLLTAFTTVVKVYGIFCSLFCHFMEMATINEEEIKNDAINKMLKLFGPLVGVQHIDFMIMLVDGELAPMYNIKTMLSLLAFEFANSYSNNVYFGKCKNCGHFFVQTGRTDTVYCPFPDFKHQGKTCKEIGAQVTRANKEKNDITTREYRKIYLRLKMQAKRHPKDLKIQEKIEILVTEGKEWRRKLSQGVVTSDEFLVWLNEYGKNN